MKNILLISILICSTLPGYSQVTIADDWTKTDCDGVEHNLFSELDAGNVVVMEMIMLESCLPCINAAHLMQPVIDQYNVSFDNRIKWYTLGYNNTYVCEDLITWTIDNEVTCSAQFEEGADQIAYYGGMGMPTIVVLGRNSHTVYFNKFGFVPGDTVALAEAIEYALGVAEPVAITEDSDWDLSIFPNPANDFIHFSGLPDLPFTLSIINSSGSTVLFSENNRSSLNIQSLPCGLYFVKILSQETLYLSQFVKY